MGEPANLPFIRVQLCLKKKDEVTDEFFHDYWKGNHVKLALENKKFSDNVIRYNQVSPQVHLKNSWLIRAVPYIT
jgi:hypothetical protein